MLHQMASGGRLEALACAAEAGKDCQGQGVGWAAHWAVHSGRGSEPAPAPACRCDPPPPAACAPLCVLSSEERPLSALLKTLVLEQHDALGSSNTRGHCQRPSRC